MEANQALYNYMLRIGDSCLIMGQRLAEWCSNGPILEEDLAMSNLSLDLFGQAEGYYVEALKKNHAFENEDHLAFRRNEQEYFNFLICEQENGNFADTMAKLYLFSTYMQHLHEVLKEVDNSTVASLSDRALKEMIYHKRHSADWLKRLSLGTDESSEKMQNALQKMWSYTADLTARNDVDKAIETLLSVNLSVVEFNWKKEVEAYLASIKLEIPKESVQITGGIEGKHTEKLGHLLCEMQNLQRAYPDAKW
jgi:ring-1,2-phenylacetyl-CoA epoxidase subunit PaaC